MSERQEPATAMTLLRLPDDIEQKLLVGQRLRATYDLIERRGIARDEARTLVGRWLFERRQTGPGFDEIEPIGQNLKPDQDGSENGKPI